MKNDVMGRLACDLTGTFKEVYAWFDVGSDKLYAAPRDGGWNVAEILEHISLTNYYLLILIRKGVVKAIDKARTVDYKPLLQDYDIDWNKMEIIGTHGAFKWDRPAHMEPSGQTDLGALKQKLKLQESECLDLLHQVKDGQGVLYKTMMTVNGLGKIDVYHYVCFLIQHTRRHLVQMDNCVK